MKPLWTTVQRFLIRLRTELPFDPMGGLVAQTVKHLPAVRET